MVAVLLKERVVVDMTKIANMSFISSMERAAYPIAPLTSLGRQVASSTPFFEKRPHTVSLFRITADRVSHDDVLDLYRSFELTRLNPFVLLEYNRLYKIGEVDDSSYFSPNATLFDVSGTTFHALFTEKQADVDEALAPTWDAGIYFAGESR